MRQGPKTCFQKYNSVEKGFKYINPKTQVSGTRLKYVHLSNKHQSVQTELKYMISKIPDHPDSAQKHVSNNIFQLIKASNTSIKKHKSMGQDTNTSIK